MEVGSDYPVLEDLPDEVKYNYRQASRPSAGYSSPHFWWYIARYTSKSTPGIVPRGRVVGGSSAINAAIFLRGVPEDYDSWTPWDDNDHGTTSSSCHIFGRSRLTQISTAISTAQVPDIAADRGILLLLENEGGLVGDTPERCLALLEGVDSPGLSFVWDTGNFPRSGVSRAFDRGWPLLRSRATRRLFGAGRHASRG